MGQQKNESEKPDVPDQPDKKRLIDVRDQAVKAPYGMCPKMSRCQAVVVPSRTGTNVAILSAPQVTTVNMEVPCMGPRCQWWIPEWESCCVRGIATIREIASALKPTSWKENLKTQQSVESYLNEKINKLIAEVERLSGIVAEGRDA